LLRRYFLTRDDLSTAVDLLYEHVESRWANEKPLPGKIDLIKLAGTGFGLGLLSARNLVSLMEYKHETNLRDIGYFSE